MIFAFLIGSLIAAGASAFVMLTLKRSIVASAGAGREKMTVEIAEVTTRLEDLVKRKDDFASQAQYDSLASQIGELEKSFEEQKKILAEIEGKLDGQQKTVEDREAKQQELKASKEEDEVKLQGLLDSFQATADEAVSLEQKLAASLKNMDLMREQMTLDNDQKALCDNISSSLENSGSRLRDLLMEYSGVNERLLTLTQQHKDLEEEYTKLVEQQLGE